MPDEDYDAIEAAVMDTARGRWFLAEFARRNRTADTALLLSAIERLEGTLAARDTPAVAALPAPAPAPAPATPEPPVAELPAPTVAASSAEAELFALEEPDAPCVILPLQHADDVVWHEETVAPPPAPVSEPVAIPEAQKQPVAEIAPEPAVEPAELVVIDEPAPAARVPSNNAVLASALSRAEEVVARASEPAPPPPPPSYTPRPVSFAELDAMSFEEKSVYFA